MEKRGAARTVFKEMDKSNIDHGGLFHVNNEVYVFFHSIEGFTKNMLMEYVLNDVDVQYHWSSIASDIDEKAAQMLSMDTVEL